MYPPTCSNPYYRDSQERAPSCWKPPSRGNERLICVALPKPISHNKTYRCLMPCGRATPKGIVRGLSGNHYMPPLLHSPLTVRRRLWPPRLRSLPTMGCTVIWAHLGDYMQAVWIRGFFKNPSVRILEC